MRDNGIYDSMKTHYQDYLDKISLCLLPHHGAETSWNEDILSDMPKCFFWVASSGISHPHRHPRMSVIWDVLENNRAIFLCNELQPVNSFIKEAFTGKDGAPMILIPAGEFQMGSNDGEDDEKPIHTIYLDAFYIDVYEVTNERYARFLNEYGKNTDDDGNELLHFDSSYLRRIEKVGDTYKAKSGYENHPVLEVSWYGADAYARFYGKRLPTEAQWEKAARGSLVGMNYPWGDEITAENANYGRRIRDTTPVGSYPPNGYGLCDMAGNVWEWCSDWYAIDYYSGSPERNPKGADSGMYRVLRGGSLDSYPFLLCVSYRYDFGNPVDSYDYVGFRCVSQDSSVTP